MEKAGFTCHSCGSKDKQLQVHHPRYIKGRCVWEYDDNELVCWCSDCHKDYEETAKQYALQALSKLPTSVAVRAAIAMYEIAMTDWEHSPQGYDYANLAAHKFLGKASKIAGKHQKEVDAFWAEIDAGNLSVIIPSNGNHS